MDTYKLIEEKYLKFGLGKNYKFNTILDAENILDFKISKCSGYTNLLVDDKEKFKIRSLNFLNGYGLQERERRVPIKIEKETTRFKVYFNNYNFSYLYLNGSIG